MMTGVLLRMTAFALCLLNPVFAAAEPLATTVDSVTLKDGSVIYGEVIEMEAGLLIIKNPSAGDLIKIKWAEVSSLKVTHPIPFQLKEGTVITGTAEEGEPGFLRLKAEPLQGTLAVPMESVSAVNPLVQPPVLYVGTLTGGFS